MNTMAESGETGGSWWGGWLQAAKETSASALEMVKKDFAEYTCTMQQDTRQVVAATTEKMKQSMQAENATAAKERVKFGFTSFLEGLTKVLVVEAEDKETTGRQPNKSDPVFDRAKARLHAIQLDPGTYCNQPSGSPEHFQEWVKSFSIEDNKGDISELLVSKVEVRALYTKLVPSEISHADFWQRYFYKVHQLQLDEARKLALMKRAEQAQTKEDSIGWEDDWSGEEDNGEDRLKGEHVKNTEKKIVTNRLSTTEVDVHSSKHTSDNKERKTYYTQVTEPDNVLSNNSKESSLCNNIVSEEVCETRVTENKIGSDIIAVDEKTVSSSPKPEKSQVPKKKDNEKIQEPETTNSKQAEIEQTSCELNTNAEEMEGEQNINVKETEGTDVEQPSNVLETTPDLKTETVQETEICKPDELEIKMKEKGDVVVVNPDRDSPSSESSGKKESENTDDDWEQDFDVDLTEEDIKAADEIAKKLNLTAKDYTNLAADVGEEWESWE